MANNKFKKLMAAALVGSMMVMLVGCGKPSPKKLQDVAVKEFGAEELELDDIEDLDEGDAQHLDDGFVLYCTGEDIEDEYGDEIEKQRDQYEKEYKALKKQGFDMEDIIGIDPTDYDVEDIKDMTVYVMADGVAKPEEDLFVQFAMVIEYADKEKANDSMKAAMDNFVERSEIDTKGLNKGEYSYKGNKCQFVINGDMDLATDFISDAAGIIAKKMGEDDIEKGVKEMKKELKEEVNNDVNYVVGVYYDNGVCTIICGVTMDEEFDQIPTIAKKLGVTDPTKVEMSDAMYDAILNYIDETLDDDLMEKVGGVRG